MLFVVPVFLIRFVISMDVTSRVSHKRERFVIVLKFGSRIGRMRSLRSVLKQRFVASVIHSIMIRLCIVLSSIKLINGTSFVFVCYRVFSFWYLLQVCQIPLTLVILKMRI